MAGDASDWLYLGENITVGNRQNAFYVFFYGSGADYRETVNISGKQHTLTLSDLVEAPTADRNWKAFYEQKYEGEDSNHSGFDFVRPK